MKRNNRKVKNNESFKFKLFKIIIIITFILAYRVYIASSESRTNNHYLFMCKLNKPQLNISGWVSDYCYGKVWHEYCKVSYPKDCPKNIEGIK